MALLVAVAVSCKEKDQPVTGVTLNPSLLTLTLEIDQTETLTVTVLPENATNKAVTWGSSDNNLVMVANGTITAKDEGTAIVTVTTEDGNYKAACTVTVLKPHPAEPELIKVESGTFTMGCTDGECYEDGRELPAHQVTVSSFKIAKYQVTQKQWKAVMGTLPSMPYNLQGDNLPVPYISWNNAQEFIDKLNEATGKKYRLPTEAEWEFAARGGNKGKGYKYSGSDDIDKVTWYKDNSKQQPQPVGMKTPNELGIYDMSGNVWECCSDWYGPYADTPQTNPTGASQGTERLARGGSFFCETTNSRVSSRANHAPELTYYGLGLRLVLPN